MLKPDDLILRHVVATAENYSEMNLGKFVAIGCKFVRSNFSKLKAGTFTFAGGADCTLYKECNFNGIKLQNLVVGPARFEGCSFENISFSEFSTDAAEFIDCVFSGRIKKGYVNGTPSEEWQHDLRRDKNEIQGNDFSRVEFEDFDFRTGVDLRSQRLPIDPSRYVFCSDPLPRIRALREFFLSWKEDMEQRRLAFIVFDMFEREVSNGQRQLFICKSRVKPYDRKMMEIIYDCLADKQR
jgi:hypothetical protein